MFVIDQIVSKIIEVLLQRKDKVCIRSARDSFFDEVTNIRDFIYHQNITINEIGILLLKSIIEMDEEKPLVQYVYRAFDFDCKVTLKLAFSEVRLLDITWLIQTPFYLESLDSKRYIALPLKSITYQDVAVLKENTILFIDARQIITDSAKELLVKRKIQWINKEAIIC